jgi:hypothetical protein
MRTKYRATLRWFPRNAVVGNPTAQNEHSGYLPIQKGPHLTQPASLLHWLHPNRTIRIVLITLNLNSITR